MKKILWVIHSFLFLLLSSCSTYFNVSKENEFADLQKRKHVDVLYIETGLLDTLHFSEKYPGRIENGRVTGIRQTLLEYLNPDSIIFKKLTNSPDVLYAIKEGIRYEILNQDNRKLAFNLQEVINVPYSDINQMYVKVSRPYFEKLFLMAVTGVSAGLALMIISSMGEIGNTN